MQKGQRSGFVFQAEQLRLAWQTNDQALARQLHAARPFTFEDLATRNGPNEVEILQWLCDSFAFKRERMGAVDQAAFLSCCANNRLALLRKLERKGHITRELARADGSLGLAVASISGKAEVMQWLVATFGLADDVRGRLEYLLKAARERGHHDVVSWLVDEFGPRA